MWLKSAHRTLFKVKKKMITQPKEITMHAEHSDKNIFFKLENENLFNSFI